MSDLIRLKQGNFGLDECYTLNEIENNNYKLKKIDDILNFDIKNINNSNYKKIMNGCKILDIYNKEYIMFSLNNKVIAIYKKDGKYLVPFKMNLDD